VPGVYGLIVAARVDLAPLERRVPTTVRIRILSAKTLSRRLTEEEIAIRHVDLTTEGIERGPLRAAVRLVHGHAAVLGPSIVGNDMAPATAWEGIGPRATPIHERRRENSRTCQGILRTRYLRIDRPGSSIGTTEQEYRYDNVREGGVKRAMRTSRAGRSWRGPHRLRGAADEAGDFSRLSDMSVHVKSIGTRSPSPSEDQVGPVADRRKNARCSGQCRQAR